MNLRCTKCKVFMEEFEGGVQCPICGKKYFMKDGILTIGKPQYYYSEYSSGRDKQKSIVEKISSQTNIKGLIKVISKEYPEIREYIFSPKRCDFLYLLPDFIEGDKTLFLDVGCGFGNALMFKKDDAKFLYGMEPTYERIYFLKKWLELEDVDNILPIMGEAKEIPFYGDIDIVLLNGVLEWIGYFENMDKPEEVVESQLEVLRSCYSSLKEDGVLVIAIENRYSPLFLYQPDHGGTYFTSFLPRNIANFITKLLHKRPYNTYTYSYWGYKKMLKDVGFRDVRVYGCYPIYRRPKIVYTLENDIFNKIPPHLIESASVRERAYLKFIFQSLSLSRLLSTSYIIFAFKKNIRLVGDLLFY